MIDFTKPVESRKRQDSVWVNEYILNDGAPALEPVEYKIHTGFWRWIDFEKKITEKETIDLVEFDCLYRFGRPDNRKEGFDQLFIFYKNEQPLPRKQKSTGVIGYDYLMDSEYIFAAFLQRYGINLLESDMHWHDFLSLFGALIDTKLNQIMAARFDDSRKGAMYEMKKAWEIQKLEKRSIPKMV